MDVAMTTVNVGRFADLCSSYRGLLGTDGQVRVAEREIHGISVSVSSDSSQLALHGCRLPLEGGA
jgi:hypothetical protein